MQIKNQLEILNLKKKKRNNSAATVGMVKELFPFTKNNLYREYFEEFYDFTDATNYKLTIGASAVTFTGVNPNLTFQPTKDLSVIQADGLNVNNYALTQKVTHSANVTLCLVMLLWLNRRFFIQANVPSSIVITRLNFDTRTKRLFLRTHTGATHIDLPDSFNGKKVVLWLTEYSNINIIKASISNYSATLTRNTPPVNSGRNNFQLITEDGMFYRLMYSTKFHDFDSEVYQRVMPQEKLNGSYVV